ncbi:MAG: alpha/beta fold hydrolase [bacterium]
MSLGHWKRNPLLDKLRGAAPAGEGEGDFFTASDGVKLFYQFWLPPGEPDRVVLCLHGMAGHGHYYSLAADHLVPDGAAVYCPDYRGHGLSEGARGDLDVARNLSDASEFLSLLRTRHPRAPVFLLGESLGAIIAINYAARFPEGLAGIILLAPPLRTRFIPGAREILLLPYYVLSLLIRPREPSIFVTGREHHGIKNPDHVTYDRTDPLKPKRIPPHFLTELRRLMAFGRIAAPSRIALPVIVFQGLKDYAVDPRGTAAFFDRLAAQDKTLKTYPDGFHAMFTDPSCADLLPTIVAWTKKSPR